MPIKPVNILPANPRRFVNNSANRVLPKNCQQTPKALFTTPDTYLASKDKALFDEPRYYFTTDEEFQRQQQECFIGIKTFFSSFQKRAVRSEDYMVNDALLMINTHKSYDTFDVLRVRKVSPELHDSKLNFEVEKLNIMNCKIVSDLPEKTEKFTFRKLYLYPENNTKETLIETGEGLCKAVEEALLSPKNKTSIKMNIDDTLLYFNPYFKRLDIVPETKASINKAIPENLSIFNRISVKKVHTKTCDYRIKLYSKGINGRIEKVTVESDEFPALTVDGAYFVKNKTDCTHDAPSANFNVTVLKDAQANKYSVIDSDLTNALAEIHNMPTVHSKAFECEKLELYSVM